MSVNNIIDRLLNGEPARSVIEAIASSATHYTALMMRYGVPEEQAVKRAVKMIGHQADDEILHMATKTATARKDPNIDKHWAKQGHYDPTKTPKYLDAAGNSIDD